MKTRQAAVEGRFYPSTRSKIFEQIRQIETAGRYPLADLEVRQIYGAILPHAGHVYSGHQTVPFFLLMSRLGIKPDTFVIIHPNHTGMGEALAVDDADLWVNSAGEVPMDRELATNLDLPFDPMAHAREHSAEVIIPFLQYYLGDHPFSIVPVCMRDQNATNAKEIAEKVLHAADHTGRKIMVLASCDFSHFLPPEQGRKMDQHVVDKILEKSIQGVEKTVRENRVSVCGFGPIMTLMYYAASLDPDYRIQILARGSSGDVIPSREVVDYISMIMYQ